MRAIIDIGTNSVLLLLASRDSEGRVLVTDDVARVTRLGQGAAQSRRLHPEAIERTLAVLREYRALADQHQAQLEAVATEGLRMAEDADAFLGPAARVLGQPVRLISGDEEAELSYRSVAQELPGDAPLHVLDIGGGSTELVVGCGPQVLDRRSHPMGSVRLTEQYVRSDPPTKAEVEAMAAAARRNLATQVVAPLPELHGLAGTVTTMAALLLLLDEYDRHKVDGSRFAVWQVEGLRDRLASMTQAERCRFPALPPGRADVIVAGVTILVEALRHCGAQTLVVRDRGLRYALV
ncbi:Ppx/GppA phosphatase family protein [Paraliomyxa miuraensis]|uniref:Ppx/GppA phosphatase family protein n=1 Tax=Paraliomyxa miuraensis TaxID=376150 RepID=UPI002252FAAC|nr:Ppx/GppA family phosphatase [Paraliomyxa miuraensis]MCX4247647.1 Ppx/GppA family phosphatase [Paraliomyxa miuraensis]